MCLKCSYSTTVKYDRMCDITRVNESVKVSPFTQCTAQCDDCIKIHTANAMNVQVDKQIVG